MGFNLTEPLIKTPQNFYNSICWVFILMTTFLFLGVSIYHICMLYKNSKLSISALKERKSILISLIMLFVGVFFMIACIHMTYTETFTNQFIQCIIPKYSATTTYSIFKALMYIVFVIRLKNIFDKNTFVHYSKIWLNICSAFNQYPQLIQIWINVGSVFNQHLQLIKIWINICLVFNQYLQLIKIR